LFCRLEIHGAFRAPESPQPLERANDALADLREGKLQAG
jgi:hypothetical protein